MIKFEHYIPAVLGLVGGGETRIEKRGPERSLLRVTLNGGQEGELFTAPRHGQVRCASRTGIK